MQFDIITLFPDQVQGMLNHSILAKAVQKGLITINIHDLRDWTEDKRKTVDDKPFGGGPGMLMMVEPIYKALKSLGVYPHSRGAATNQTHDSQPKTHVLLTSASGKQWNQQLAQEYAKSHERVVIICGHYEGVDHRVTEHLVDAEISVGNYVLTGGELAAGIIVDSTSRLIPGVLGNEDSLLEESHNQSSVSSEHDTDNNTKQELSNYSTRQLDNYSEYPQYTRPAEFVTEEGDTWKVPDILLSGDHQKIKQWKTYASQ